MEKQLQFKHFRSRYIVDVDIESTYVQLIDSSHAYYYIDISNKTVMDQFKHWLKTFFRRFFSQQFKRSCLPDGPKVGSISLSPRGDWRMPSDASSELWLRECEML